MKIKLVSPVPLSNLERIGFAVSAGGEIVDPPLSKSRRRFDPICGIAHPSELKSGCNFIDAIEDSLQPHLS